MEEEPIHEKSEPEITEVEVDIDGETVSVGSRVDKILKGGTVGIIIWTVVKGVAITIGVFNLFDDYSILENVMQSSALIAADLVTSPTLYAAVAAVIAMNRRKLSKLWKWK